ncbi:MULTISPECIES: hypothetical protein [Corynebacterium]|uniref:hypothetical protein n=1 Tax=Corynebacterium TaxID=1716 RepID=UPI00124DDD45|nr:MULTISPECIES: hypothetical protein [Corynebacterium]
MSLTRALRSIAVAAAAVTLPLLSAPVAVAEPAPALVDQGDVLLTDAGNGQVSSCTIGYVDEANGRAWTDAHCGANGTEVYDAFYTPIGRLHHIYPDVFAAVQNSNDSRWGPVSRMSDVAYIEFYDSKFIGQNYFSGDTIAQPEVGDKLCTYGNRTQRIACSPILYLTGPVAITADVGSDHGDSGGPAWIEGKGYFGQLLGADWIWRSDQGKITTTVFRQIGNNDLARPLDLHQPVEGYEPDFNLVRSQPVTSTADADRIMNEKRERDAKERERVERHRRGETLEEDLQRARTAKNELEGRKKDIEEKLENTTPEEQIDSEDKLNERAELERELEEVNSTLEIVSEQTEIYERITTDTTDYERSERRSLISWLTRR